MEVIHGNSLVVMQGIPPSSIDAIITDPPYSSGGLYRGDRSRDTKSKYLDSGKIQAEYAKHNFLGDNMDQRAWTNWTTDWLSVARNLVKPGGVATLFTDWRQIAALSDAIQWAGWLYRGLLVWDKKNSRRFKA